MIDSRGEVVAIIPARGGSKGIPRKNIQQVGGMPLVARAIRSAIACPLVDRVVVTTDDEEIALVATMHGAEVVARPAVLAMDEATSESSILHALHTLKSRGINARIVVFLQSTSPFIDEADLEEAIRMVDSEYDVVFSACETFAFLWTFGSRGAVGVNHDDSYRPRRQDRDPQFLETGAFYVMRARGFLRRKFRFFGRIGMVLVHESDAIEIDTREQLELAELMATVRLARAMSVGTESTPEIDAVVTDFDGVHTNDRALVGQDGRESVEVSRSDGMGIQLLREAGIPVLILSAETNPVVQARAQKLGVDARQGLADKTQALVNWVGEQGVDLSRVAYLGNDVNDLGCLEIVGWPIAVANAHPSVKAASRLVLTRRGGDGAVRELAEHVMANRKVQSH